MTEQQTNSRPRVLSGMRPTGKLHLGNYMGALYNWVQLQHQYECYFFIADWHALTTDYADPSRLLENTLEVALDFLAAGLDHEKCTMFVQSHVPQHAELHLLLSMITPLSWLERVPSYKDQQEQLKQKELNTYGFLGYPLLQTADILLYRPDFVPVGLDQAAHVEITREIARRFNSIYQGKLSEAELAKLLPATSAKHSDILPEPKVMLTESPKLPGIDGRKMSKSYGNTITLTDASPIVISKMESMTNGGQRALRSDPGNPDQCPVYDLHKVFTASEMKDQINLDCRTAAISCIDCKREAAKSISTALEPIQAKRFYYEANQPLVIEILQEGTRRASETANATLSAVREAMGLIPNMRGKRAETSMDRALYASHIGHSLFLSQELWDDDEKRPEAIRSHWLNKIVPRDIVLKKDLSSVFVTPTGKRAYVTTSREIRDGEWEFEAKPKSYEMLVLLCAARDFDLTDISDLVIPQRIYIQVWTRLKKQDKTRDITFKITQSGDQFVFNMDGEETDVTEFLSNYGPML